MVTSSARTHSCLITIYSFILSQREDIMVCEEREDIKVCEEGGH